MHAADRLIGLSPAVAHGYPGVPAIAIRRFETETQSFLASGPDFASPCGPSPAPPLKRIPGTVRPRTRTVYDTMLRRLCAPQVPPPLTGCASPLTGRARRR